MKLLCDENHRDCCMRSQGTCLLVGHPSLTPCPASQMLEDVVAQCEKDAGIPHNNAGSLNDYLRSLCRFLGVDTETGEHPNPNLLLAIRTQEAISKLQCDAELGRLVRLMEGALPRSEDEIAIKLICTATNDGEYSWYVICDGGALATNAETPEDALRGARIEDRPCTP